jgi:GntR family transcriptional regulator/MocR family aminotransferase
MSLFSVDVINPNMSGRPAHARISERIRGAIASGALAQKARLPSSRTLARDFGVARNTVDEALSQLVAEGLIIRRRGAGSFVTNLLPNTWPPLAAAHRVAERSAPWAAHLETREVSSVLPRSLQADSGAAVHPVASAQRILSPQNLEAAFEP